MKIINSGAEEKSIAKVGEAVVFIKSVVTGDFVYLYVTKNRRRFYKKKPIKFHAYSNNRTEG